METSKSKNGPPLFKGTLIGALIGLQSNSLLVVGFLGGIIGPIMGAAYEIIFGW